MPSYHQDPRFLILNVDAYFRYLDYTLHEKVNTAVMAIRARHSYLDAEFWIFRIQRHIPGLCPWRYANGFKFVPCGTCL